MRIVYNLLFQHICKGIDDFLYAYGSREMASILTKLSMLSSFIVRSNIRKFIRLNINFYKITRNVSQKILKQNFYYDL